jgi:hypothetical protein
MIPAGIPHRSRTVVCSCGGPVYWSRRTWTRPDGYADWDLAIWCPRCGPLRDALIRAAVRVEYDALLGDVISRAQARALSRCCSGASAWTMRA